MMPVEFRAPKTSAKTTTCTRLMPGNPAFEMPMPSAPATASVHCSVVRDGIRSRADYIVGRPEGLQLRTGDGLMRNVIFGVAAIATSFMLAAATPSAQQAAPG